MDDKTTELPDSPDGFHGPDADDADDADTRQGALWDVPADSEIRRLILQVLAHAGLQWPNPAPDDHIFFIRGKPIAPWQRPQPNELVWRTWLQRLEALHAVHTPTAGDALPWPDWYASHIHMFHASRVSDGMETLAALLGKYAGTPGRAHIVGHSVGGAVALGYLAHLRAGRIAAAAQLPVHSVITLEASVTHVAALWSGAVRLRSGGERPWWNGLGAWAEQRDIALLTASNRRDFWSHRPLDDVPYLGLELAPAVVPRFAQIKGTFHGLLRATPQLAEALWSDDGMDADDAAPFGLGAGG